MTDPIRAALDKAAEAVRVSFIEEGSCYGGDACHALPCKCASDAATKAIAAFNRTFAQFTTDEEYFSQLHEIADAVLAAAKDQIND
jgi:hypothetical protein